jgi:negative regulator of sigma E activity
MMKRVSVLALAVVAAATLACADAQPAVENASATLSAAMGAPASLSYVGTVEVTRSGHAAATEIFEVEHRAPDLTRRLYAAPADLSGETMLLEHGVIFSIDPKHRRVVERRSDPREDSTALDADAVLLRANYRVIPGVGETIAGRRTLGLVLINKYGGQSTMIVQIDVATKLLLEKEEFAADGTLVCRTRFEKVRYLPVPAADFALPSGFTISRGSQLEGPPQRPDRAAGSAGFAVREPRSLPGGFAAVEGDLVVLHGVRTVHFLYSDGVRSVSIFENASASNLEASGLQSRWIRVAGYNAEYAEDGAMALLSWSDGTLHYTLVGETGLVDLQRLAGAIDR